MAAEDRIARVRDRLRDGTGPEVSFSAGRARLEPGGHPDDALRAADASMYAAKGARPASRAS
jgi:GGDEF domain-containing protein